MPSRLVRTTTADHLLLDGVVHEPEEPPSRTLLYVHGMPENFYGSPLLEPLATACIERGWAMVSGNNRGHDYVADIAVAGSPATYRRIGNTWEHFPDCVVDIKSWIGACPTPRVTLMGHSLGASKVAYYMAETADPLVDALVDRAPWTCHGSSSTPIPTTQSEWRRRGG